MLKYSRALGNKVLKYFMVFFLERKRRGGGDIYAICKWVWDSHGNKKVHPLSILKFYISGPNKRLSRPYQL